MYVQEKTIYIEFSAISSFGYPLEDLEHIHLGKGGNIICVFNKGCDRQLKSELLLIQLYFIVLLEIGAWWEKMVNECF